MQHLDEGTIHAWIDGELSPEQADEVAAHVSTCPECAAMVAEARGLVAASTRILTALDDVPGGVIPSVPDITPTQMVRRRWYQRTDLRAAAALLFVAGASLLVARSGTDSVASRAMMSTADKGQAAQSTATEATGGGSAEVPPQALADGASAATRSSKEEAARTRAPDVANAPPPAARVDAAAPSMAITPAETRSGVSAAGVVEGRVIDKERDQGVSGAQVLVEGTTLSVATDNDGKFRIENVPSGSQRLHVRRIGYQATTIPLSNEKGIAAATVVLSPSQMALEEVVVTSIATAPSAATVGAAANKTVATGPLRVVRADSTGSTKRTVYEVSRGVEVTLTESSAQAAAERDNAADAVRQKVATLQSSAAAREEKQVEILRRQVADAATAAASAPALPLNSIEWTERGRKYILTGRLTTKDLEVLKARVMQIRR